MQLGMRAAPKDLPAVPMSSDEGSSPKRRREPAAGPEAASGARSKKSKMPQGFDWETLRVRLCEHRDDIVRNSKEHVDSVCRALEERVQEKFQGVDRTVGDVNLRLQGMEAKVERLEGLL